ncbi:FkbM family methyltransferase [Pelagivirga sediminicola]|uniref:FkbM family methyltransferase n=1 Tax=Pelagivirga sediminicola TaxID=2170575 RepID=A0A2T7GAK6_9RHOB|nr:FkbM family methyltransferase [Pelagivirga sediminicola]PVA11457.1 FkbM family methyltransferase [Pelagivirga sediminicola]
MASLKKFFERRRNPWKGIAYDAYEAFSSEGAQSRLEEYPDLPEAPMVLDFGGYLGEWSDRVLAQYHSATIHMFEPHPDFAAKLQDKYGPDARVHVHDFALGARAGTMDMPDAADGSSAVAAHERSFQARIVAVQDFFAQHDLLTADLVKINIEGGEYDLLPALMDSGDITRLNRIQVQFHLFSEDLIAARDAIRTRLEQTHDCVWSYPFVWEEWRRKAAP